MTKAAGYKAVIKLGLAMNQRNRGRSSPFPFPFSVQLCQYSSLAGSVEDVLLLQCMLYCIETLSG